MLRSRSVALTMAICLILLNIFDASITLWFLDNLIAEEWNPITHHLIKELGYFFVVLKGFITLLLGMLLVHAWTDSKVARYGGLFTLFVYLLVACYHMYGIIYFS